MHAPEGVFWGFMCRAIWLCAPCSVILMLHGLRMCVQGAVHFLACACEFQLVTC